MRKLMQLLLLLLLLSLTLLLIPRHSARPFAPINDRILQEPKKLKYSVLNICVPLDVVCINKRHKTIRKCYRETNQSGEFTVGRFCYQSSQIRSNSVPIFCRQLEEVVQLAGILVCKSLQNIIFSKLFMHTSRKVFDRKKDKRAKSYRTKLQTHCSSEFIYTGK